MPRIEEMYAFVAEERATPDDEGVVAFMSARTGEWIPLVGADMTRVWQLYPVAKQMARITGQRIRLLRFSVREELEVIEP